MTTILKLGGSVLTDKNQPETTDEQAIEHAAATVTGHDDLVLVHGGGSFGHHHATNHGVSRTAGTHDARAVRDIHDAMKALNGAVLDALHAAGVPAVPVHPLSVGHRTADGTLDLPLEQIQTMLTEGFVPVVHGDVVVHEGKGATILSGDELVVALASGLDAERVGLCSAVAGVLGTDGAVIQRIDSFEEVADALGESDATDVTGGMAAKVRELLALDSPAYVFDRDGIAPFLAGDEPGTRIGRE